MINFASLFGTFNRGGNSAISDLLQKRTTTLDVLLDLDNFTNEYKSGNNTKIIEFMTYQKYQQLIEYVTVQGPADNQKKGYKFPMVAADILSAENNLAIDFILPDGDIQVDVEYKETEEFEVEVDDVEDQQYLTQESPQKAQTPTETAQQAPKTEEKAAQTTTESTQPSTQATNEAPTDQPEGQKPETEEPKPEPVKQKKKKLIKQTRTVTKTRKQKRDPLIGQLLSYYQGLVNYTLAGYNCKVLSLLFTKKPSQFLNFFFKSGKNYVELVCNHVESKSVGDLLTKILVWETTEFVEERKQLYDHLIHLMSTVNEAHVISNLSYTISEIIEKTSTYVKSKQNITNNQEIIKAFLSIFYRTSEVHKIVNNSMSEDQNRSGYNCMVLHSYLHHTEVQTFNSFKLEEVLESFITKAAEKLRNIPNRRTLGMGRVKIVEIFSFLIRKQPKTIQDDTKQTEMTSELLEELYIHTIIAKITDFFSILIKLVQAFENNNILHNEFYKIIESVLKEPYENKSALQELLLNDDNVLVKFIVAENETDKQLRTAERPTKRKGYIGHVINICKLIEQIQNNELLTQRVKKAPQFQEVLNTLVAVDIQETNRSLAGYQIKKNPVHDIMFQKEDILTAYADFLTHCPKPTFEIEEPESEEEPNEAIAVESEEPKKSEDQMMAEKQLEQQKIDEQKFNQAAAMSEQVNETDPKFWINHIKYDIDQLMQDVL